MKVLVEGRLTADQSTGGPRIWNRQDGTPAASFEINAATVRFLTPRGEVEADTPFEGGQAAADDDIPF